MQQFYREMGCPVQWSLATPSALRSPALGHNRSLLNGGNGTGSTRHLCGKIVSTRPTRRRHTCLPSNHFVCGVKINQGPLRHQHVTCLSHMQEKRTPDLKVPNATKYDRFWLSLIWLQKGAIWAVSNATLTRRHLRV